MEEYLGKKFSGVISPELCDDNREPLTNPNYRTGMRVSAIGLPAPREWTTTEGLKVFRPRHFGYEIAYVPLERK